MNTTHYSTMLPLFQSRNELGGGGRRIKLNKCLQPVPLSYSPDSTIRFGDTILLESCETGGALACDPFEEVRYFSITVRYFPLLAKAPAVNVTLQIYNDTELAVAVVVSTATVLFHNLFDYNTI
jgi:hypothetical protein